MKFLRTYEPRQYDYDLRNMSCINLEDRCDYWQYEKTQNRTYKCNEFNFSITHDLALLAMINSELFLDYNHQPWIAGLLRSDIYLGGVYWRPLG